MLRQASWARDFGVSPSARILRKFEQHRSLLRGQRLRSAGYLDSRMSPGLTENFFSATGKRAARFNPRSEFASSLPVFGCCARGTAKRLREMALVGETCLERDKRNGFPAT